MREAEQQKRATQKLPLLPTILMALFEERFARFTVQGTPLPNAEALDSMGAMLSAMLTLESAQRGGNWIKASGTLAQPVRTEDVRFQVGAGATQSSGRRVNSGEFIGEAARTELGDRSSETIDLSQVKRVNEIYINILSTKQGKPVINQKIARRTKEEEIVLEATVAWIILSGTRDKDPFLTRYAPTPKTKKQISRRLVTNADRTEVVKASARKAGMDDRHFSSTSLRKAGITIVSEVAGPDEAARRSGHSRTSGVMSKHYDFSQHGGLGASVGPSALSGEKGFGIEQLKALMPASRKGEQEEPEKTSRTGSYWNLKVANYEGGGSKRGTRKKSVPKKLLEAVKGSSKR